MNNGFNGPIKPGEHRGCATEFTSGCEPTNKVPVGTATVRKHRGVRRAWVKIDEPNSWELRAVRIWKDANGPVANGFVLHHINGEPLDDRLENLALIARSTHPKLHRDAYRSAMEGKVHVTKSVVCSNCSGTFNGKYQRKDTLCNECYRKRHAEANSRYKQRVRAQAG